MILYLFLITLCIAKVCHTWQQIKQIWPENTVPWSPQLFMSAQLCSVVATAVMSAQLCSVVATVVMSAQLCSVVATVVMSAQLGSVVATVVMSA